MTVAAPFAGSLHLVRDESISEPAINMQRVSRTACDIKIAIPAAGLTLRYQFGARSRNQAYQPTMQYEVIAWYEQAVEFIGGLAVRQPGKRFEHVPTLQPNSELRSLIRLATSLL